MALRPAKVFMTIARNENGMKTGKWGRGWNKGVSQLIRYNYLRKGPSCLLKIPGRGGKHNGWNYWIWSICSL
jgi:hypothetical protein